MTIFSLLVSNPFVLWITLVFLYFLCVYLPRLSDKLYIQHYQQYFNYEAVDTPGQNGDQQFRRSTLIYLLCITILVIGFQLGDSVNLSPLVVEFFAGAFFLLFISLILIYLQNIFVFSFVGRRPESLQGHLDIKLPYFYYILASKMLSFAVIWFVSFLLFFQVFFFGGFFFTLISGWDMLRQSRRAPEKISHGDKFSEDLVPELESVDDLGENPVSCYNCSRLNKEGATFCVYCKTIF